MGPILLILFMLTTGCVLSIGIAIFLTYGTTVYCTSQKRIDGKIAIVTGGSCGIGREVALNLAQRGATVYIASRGESRGLIAVETIREQSQNHKVYYSYLDLTDFHSIKSFASHIISTETTLDILINNAGIGASYEEKTKDGNDLIFTTNYLGHFLLSYLLYGLLLKTESSRILNVSSVAHTLVRKLDLSVKCAVYGDTMYRQLQGYDMSKLAMILHAKELTRRCSGSTMTVNAATPGLCLTGLWSQSGTWWPSCLSFLARHLLRPIAQSPLVAAQTIIHGAVSSDLEGVSGKYLDKCAVGKESVVAKDAGLASKLWDISLLLTGCQDNGKIVDILPKFQYLDEDEIWEKKLARLKADRKGKEKPMLAPDTLYPLERL